VTRWGPHPLTLRQLQYVLAVRLRQRMALGQSGHAAQLLSAGPRDGRTLRLVPLPASCYRFVRPRKSHA